MKNLFELARLEVAREGELNNKNEFVLVLNRAYRIRKYMDLQARNKKVAEARYKKG